MQGNESGSRSSDEEEDEDAYESEEREPAAIPSLFPSTARLCYLLYCLHANS
jgi:hypothetical protein